jgi:hypothetical protein
MFGSNQFQLCIVFAIPHPQTKKTQKNKHEMKKYDRLDSMSVVMVLYICNLNIFLL